MQFVDTAVASVPRARRRGRIRRSEGMNRAHAGCSEGPDTACRVRHAPRSSSWRLGMYGSERVAAHLTHLSQALLLLVDLPRPRLRRNFRGSIAKFTCFPAGMPNTNYTWAKELLIGPIIPIAASHTLHEQNQCCGVLRLMIGNSILGLNSAQSQ